MATEVTARRFCARPWLLFGVRAVVGGVFIVAGVLKAMQPAAFAGDIENYQLVPHVASVALSLFLPYLEIVCGAALVARRLDRGALVLIATMLVVFIAALAAAWWRGLDIACGCFGTDGVHGQYASALLRDAGLLAASGILWTCSCDRDFSG